VVEFHMIIGLSVVVAFLLLTILNFLRWRRGSRYSWSRGLSFAASGLLLIQYLLGFVLLGGDHKITAMHYVLALAAILPVGAEHMFAGSDETEPANARSAFLTALAAFILVLVVYGIGESNS
jgi:heme A synthase